MEPAAVPTAAPPTAPPASQSGAQPATEPAAPPARLRVGTVVWGLVLAMIGVGVLAVGTGAALDVQAGLIVLLAVAGVALLIGAVVTATRTRR